jgi:gamma-F420-2:alpha-L-glutamate ligase
MIILLLTNKTLGHEARKLVQSFVARGHWVMVNTPTETPDIVLARHLGKKNPGNLYLAMHYQSLGIPVVNTPQACALARNKFESGKLFEAHNLPVPKTRELTSIEKTEEFTYPVVTKVLRGSQGKGVYLCNTREEVLERMTGPSPMIVQEYINARPGEDLRVFVIGGKVMGVMHRKSINGDFRANISQGGVGERYELTPEIENLALTAAKIVGLEICGVDLLFDHTGFKICEINATPGFRGFDKYCNTHMATAITEYLEHKVCGGSSSWQFTSTIQQTCQDE